MARSFNNSNTYLSSSTPPVTAVPLTISCWFYPAATNDTYDAVFVKDATGAHYFGIYLNWTGSSAKVGAVTAAGGSEQVAQSSTTFSASTWQHAAAVFASTTSRAAYLNGGGKATDVISVTPSSIAQVNVGGFFVSPTVFGPMNGRLAEIGVWNAALTDDEVLSLSKGASPLNVRPQSLVAYWPLYGAASPEPNFVRNSTDRSLTLNNAPTQIDHAPVMAPMSGMRRNSMAAAAAGDTILVTKADAVFTGKTVTVLDLDVIPVLKASVTVAGQTVTVRDGDVIPVTKASIALTGKTVTLVDRDVIPVTQGSITFTGKTVTIRDADVVPVAKATVLFAGKTVTIADLVATEVIPVGKADILFSGQNVTITDISVEPPTVGLPGGGGGFYVPPYIDFGRKRRRRYRALEEIEKRIDERIERLTAETRETQEKVAAVLDQNVSQPEQFDVLIRQQVRITALLHDAQKRAEKVRQERIELAKLARLAFEAADEEEAITMLLLT